MGGSYLFILLQSNYFDATVTFLEQLFLHSSYFFEELPFRNSHFLATVIFSEYLLSRSKTSTEQPLLRNRKFIRAATFQNCYLFGREIVKGKDSHRRTRFSNQVLLHSINFFREDTFSKKLIFQKRNIPYYLIFWRATFLERLLFQMTLSSIAATFSEEPLSQNVFLQKSYSYASSPQLHILFIS